MSRLATGGIALEIDADSLFTVARSCGPPDEQVDVVAHRRDMAVAETDHHDARMIAPRGNDRVLDGRIGNEADSAILS